MWQQLKTRCVVVVEPLAEDKSLRAARSHAEKPISAWSYRKFHPSDVVSFAINRTIGSCKQLNRGEIRLMLTGGHLANPRINSY